MLTEPLETGFDECDNNFRFLDAKSNAYRVFDGIGHSYHHQLNAVPDLSKTGCPLYRMVRTKIWHKNIVLLGHMIPSQPVFVPTPS